MVLQVEPYLMVARRPVNSTSSTWTHSKSDTYYGYLPDLLEALSMTLNFDYDLYMVPDGSYGYRKSAGRWSGMIGELLKGVRERGRRKLPSSSSYSPSFVDSISSIAFR